MDHQGATPAPAPLCCMTGRARPVGPQRWDVLAGRTVVDPLRLAPVECPLHDVPCRDDAYPHQQLAVVTPGRDKHGCEHTVREVAQVDPAGQTKVVPA